LARRKKKKKTWFGFGKKRKKTKAQAKAARETTITRLRLVSGIFAVVILCAGFFFGSVYLDRYVETVSPVDKEVPLLIENKPGWFNSELDSLIRATAGGETFAINKETARIVAERLQDLMWLEGVRVRVTGDAVKVNARFRKPVGLIEFKGKKFYLDENAFAMRYLPVANLPIVQIRGFSKPLNLASLRHQEDVDAALKILRLLAEMDAVSTPEKPLLAEIASIDVANFNGRKNKGKVHILLYTTDNTPIFWGSAFGMSTGEIEATDQQKLGDLYTDYKLNDRYTLLGRSKYIDLRTPR
jgi:hypothetical protein